MTVERGIVVSSLVAAALALAMLVLALTTGVSQEYFEYVHPAIHYSRTLADQDGLLRLTFSCDNLFLLAYGTFFALFAVERWPRANKVLVALVLVLGLSVALLDAIENHHILAMLASARDGDLIGAGEIRFQQLESAFKFHLSYLALVFAALVYPRDQKLGTLVSLGTGIGYPLLGVAAFTAPDGLVPLFSLLRVAFFVAGLAATGWIYARTKTSTPLR